MKANSSSFAYYLILASGLMGLASCLNPYYFLLENPCLSRTCISGETIEVFPDPFDPEYKRCYCDCDDPEPVESWCWTAPGGNTQGNGIPMNRSNGSSFDPDYFPLHVGNAWKYYSIRNGQPQDSFELGIPESGYIEDILGYGFSLTVWDSFGISDTLPQFVLYDDPDTLNYVKLYGTPEFSPLFGIHQPEHGQELYIFGMHGEVEYAGQIILGDSVYNNCYTIILSDGADELKVSLAPDVGLILYVTEADSTVLASYSTFALECSLEASFEVLPDDCNNPSGGSIFLTIENAEPPYDFAWSGPSPIGNEQNPDSLLAGIYSVTISDPMGCSYILIINLPAGPNDPVIENISTILPSCAGALDGGISEVVVSGGEPPYIITLPGNQGQDLPAGQYFIQVTDANGCMVGGSVTIADPEQFVIQGIEILLEDSCGITEACIHIHANYGITFDDCGIAPGNYPVTLNNLNGCQLDTIIQIPAGSEPLDITQTQIADLTCFRPGEIHIHAQGGTGPLNYSIDCDQFQQNPIIQVDDEGTYVVCVMDAIGCFITDTVTVEYDAQYDFSVSVDSIKGDNGSSTGAIFITIIPGATPGNYSFEWQGPGNFSSAEEDVSGLPSGTYILVVTDLNTGCVKALSIKIETSTAVDDIKYPTIELVPNPAGSYFELSGMESSQVKGIECIDLQGMRHRLRALPQSRYDIRGLSPGMYFIVVQTRDGERIASKLVKS